MRHCLAARHTRQALGVGDGTFTMGQFITLSIEQVLGITIADVTGDANLDLIASYPYLSNSKPGQYGIVIVGGIGNGTFGKPYDIAQLGAYTTAVADFNQDGISDIVGSPSVELLGKTSGGFSFETAPVPESTQQIFAADLNHDGKPDIVVLGIDQQIHVNLGNGDGTFQPTINTPQTLNDLAVLVRTKATRIAYHLLPFTTIRGLASNRSNFASSVRLTAQPFPAIGSVHSDPLKRLTDLPPMPKRV